MIENADEAPPLDTAGDAVAHKPDEIASTPPKPARPNRAGVAHSKGSGMGGAADQVGAILEAAEATAERIRTETERRVRDRIAEGERAAENRVRAAEEEAAEILTFAQQEAARVRRSGLEEAEHAKTLATSEALTIVARAQEAADSALSEANAAAATARVEAQERSQELLSDARTTVGEVRSEGLELVSNLRQMSDSLRANAERLLRDVQSIHSRMVAQLEKVDGGTGPAPRSRQRSAPRPGGTVDRTLPEPPANGEVLDVPEFIPPA